MSGPFETPPRLAHDAPDLEGAPAGGDAATRALAGRLLRLTQAAPTRLSTAARARIAARLDDAHPAEPARGRALWPAFAVAALVLFAGGAVGAAWGLAPARQFVIEILHRPSRRHVAARVAPPAAVEAPRPVVAAPPEPTIVPIEAPAPVEMVARPHAHVGARPHAAVARPIAEAPSAQPDDPIVAESRLLAEALTTLRQRRDPQQALRALDAYDRRFPAGALAPEAAAARIDALLALGRRGQALERLEALPLARLPRGAELRVLRGELRAGRGRLDEAVDDFTAVLSKGDAPAAVIERALYGRGSCRSRLGDTAGARADLREVLRRFPDGAHAGTAERALRD